MKPISLSDGELLETAMAEASRRFLETGEIIYPLHHCFDQCGAWLGASAVFPYVLPAARKRLTKITIPESQRSITNEEGESILLTSFLLDEDHIMGEKVAVIPWHEIRGMCTIKLESDLYCPHLRRLSNCYNPTDIRALTIRLPELFVVNDIILSAEHIFLPKLTCAQNIDVFHVSHVFLPHLQSVKNLHLGSAFAAHFPVLLEVHQSLVGYHVREFSAPRLERVNLSKTGEDGLLLPAAWSIDSPNLQCVGVKLDARSAETFFSPALTVDGEWNMHPNAKRIRIRWTMRKHDQDLEL